MEYALTKIFVAGVEQKPILDLMIIWQKILNGGIIQLSKLVV